MTDREFFIKEVDTLLDAVPDAFCEEAKRFYESWKNEVPASNAKPITENGIKILGFMQENYPQYNNVFKAKEIGEGLFMSGRSVSGSMKKLVADGFVEKLGKDPVTYAITDLGKSWSID